MVALVAAEATNTPVWWLFGATAALAGVTGLLALAAWRALDQLKLARSQIEDAKRDRHVQVFSDLGKRWESRDMTEALELEWHYQSQTLAALFERAGEGPSRNPLKERRRRRAAQQTVVLLRVPNYFEDAATIADLGGLESRLFVENFGGVAVDEWRLWGPTVKKLQETDPLAYVKFEELAKQEEQTDPGEPPEL
jgi:hypothetical protein